MKTQNKGGRPAGPVKEQVSFRLDPRVVKDLRHESEVTGIPMNRLAESAVRESLDRWKAGEGKPE